MNARTIVAKLLEMTPGETWNPVNHPLNKAPGHTCRKCGSARVSLPAYNGDYFDCLDCGHSWAVTPKQSIFTKNNPASFYDKNGRRPAAELTKIRQGSQDGKVFR